jgi:hypothetical protein
MLLIWGYKRYVDGLALLMARCTFQGHNAAHRLVRVRSKFTFFWIPLFTYKTQHYMQCSLCGAESEVAKEHIEAIVAEAQRQALDAQSQQYAAYDAPVDAPPSLN